MELTPQEALLTAGLVSEMITEFDFTQDELQTLMSCI